MIFVLLHAAVCKRLGECNIHANILMVEGRLCFEFAHSNALTSEDLAVIETEVNAKVRAMGRAMLFKIISEDEVSTGVRRIEALTDEDARLWLTDRDTALRDLAASLKTTVDNLPARVALLVRTVEGLTKELAAAQEALARLH